MSVVANIAINVDSTKAVSQLNAVDRAAAGVSSNTGKLQQAFGGLNTALAGLGLGALIKDLTGVGIDADRTGKRIQNLAGPTGEAGKLLDIASKAAKDFGLSNLEARKGVADLYGRLQPTGVALKDIETVYNGVNKAALAAGLSNADTSGVFLQLSQALGSGALQGDELRSIMERMPAVGQAVAKVMGVTVGEVKKLGSEGKITTEVMIKAAAELDKLTPPPPDAFKQFNAAMEDLREELGENILPLLTPFVNLLLGVVRAFSAMPEPLQTAIVALGLVATAILAIGAAVAFLAPVIAAFKTLAVVIGGLNIGGLIAGWLPVAATAMSGITAALGGLLTFVTGTLIPGLIALFSGPVGWTVLAVAAVVAMVVLFREPIGKFLAWLGNEFNYAMKVLGNLAYDVFVKPFTDLWDNVLRKPVTAMLNWIGALLRTTMQAAYWLVWAAFVLPWILLWDNVLRKPITTALAWINNEFNYAMKLLGQLAYDLFVKPWVNLWNNVLRAPVTAGIKWIQDTWKGIIKFFTDNVTTPISNAWKTMTEFLPKAIDTAKTAVVSVFTSIGTTIKSILNTIVGGVMRTVNSVINEINYLIGRANAISAKVKGPQISTLPKLSIPAFANGGIVTRPTLAMVGEGGEPEYIIPQSKMAAAAANYLGGARGASVIPSGNAQINVTTGPVMQQGGQQYVSMADLEKAMRKTADGVYASLRTPAGRYAMGVR
jgi:tape measure domain-containing protein